MTKALSLTLQHCYSAETIFKNIYQELVMAETKVKKPSGPKTIDLICTAITALNEPKGSSPIAIKKYITANLKAELNNGVVNNALKRGVASGKLTQPKGTGATGRFKINAAKIKAEAAAKAKKEKAQARKVAQKEKEKAKKEAAKAKKAEKKAKTTTKKKPNSTKKKAASEKKSSPTKKKAVKKPTKKATKPNKAVKPKKPAAKKATPKKPAAKKTAAKKPSK